MNIKEAYTYWSFSYDTDRNLTRDLGVNVLREKFKGRHFPSILEIGCGTGLNTRFLADIADHVHGIDFSEGMLKRAKNVKADNVTLTYGDLTKPWPYNNVSVDLVVCNLVLEHVENLHHIFSEAFRVLKQNGAFFICELHPKRQYLGTKATIRRDEGTTDIHAFVHHITDFLDAANQAGFVSTQVNEHWHDEDTGKPPRIVAFLFGKDQG
jgi:ubiquinone/menaquinone biosynthesis C-methylase UbiE